MRAVLESSPVAAPSERDILGHSSGLYDFGQPVIQRPVPRYAVADHWRKIDGMAGQVAAVQRLSGLVLEQHLLPRQRPPSLQHRKVQVRHRRRALDDAHQIEMHILQAR